MKQAKIIQKYNNTLASAYDEATLGEFKWVAPRETSSLILPYIKPGSRVLDVGIGTGQSSAELYKAECKITGIDISEKMLEITKQKFPAFELYQSDVEEGLSVLADRSFDIVMAVGVLEFVQNIEETIALLAEFLNFSGLLCFTFEEYLPEHELQHWRKSETGRGIVDPIPEMQSFMHYRYTPGEIEHTLERNKLQLLKKKHFQGYLKSREKLPIYYTAMLVRKI